jgi:hypothetical protein
MYVCMYTYLYVSDLVSLVPSFHHRSVRIGDFRWASRRSALRWEEHHGPDNFVIARIDSWTQKKHVGREFIFGKYVRNLDRCTYYLYIHTLLYLYIQTYSHIYIYYRDTRTHFSMYVHIFMICAWVPTCIWSMFMDTCQASLISVTTSWV